jgi:NADH-quinone oxidoreductase subunit E
MAVEQGPDTALSAAAAARIRTIAARYPHARSALLPALYVAQEEHGFVSDEAIEEIAAMLGLTAVDVQAVASFYTMFYRQPGGKYIFQVCGTLSCALCGAEEIIRHMEARLGIRAGETTPDGRFKLEAVECLGACGHGPVLLLGDRFHQNLTTDAVDRLIDELKDAPLPEGRPAPQLEGIGGPER